MKKWISFLVFCLIIQGIGWAQLIDAKSAAGQVTAKKENTITINDNKHELVLEFTSATHFIIGSEIKSAGDVHVGDRVTAVYREKGAKKTALSITVSTKK